LASHTFIHALQSLDTATYFVPLGEADGAVVAFAEKLGAYVFGQDSDYPILIGGLAATKVKGYCPLDMMMWIEGEMGSNQAQLQDYEDGWQFRQHRREGSGRSRQSPYLPPPYFSNPAFVITYIPHGALGQRLRLPASVLPLFASLCGNDYTPPTAAEYLFESGLRAAGKVEKVARVLREVLFNPNTNSPKVVNAGDHAVELVRRVIKKLAVREFSHEGAIIELVEAIIESSFQYTLPLGVECCEIYPFCGELDPLGCQTGRSRAASHNGKNEEGASAPAIKQYATAQRRGQLNSVTHAWLYPDRMYIWSVLEDPAGPSLRASEGLRGVRMAGYLIAEEGLGRMRWVDGSGGEGDCEAEIEVEPTGGAEGRNAKAGFDEVKEKTLEELLGMDTAAESGSDSEDTTLVGAYPSEEVKKVIEESHEPIPKRCIVEYVRQSNRFIGCRLDLPPLAREIPLALQSLPARLAAYLAPFQSNTPTIRALSPHLHPLVAITRLCVLECAKRAESSKTNWSKWKRSEVGAILKAGIETYGQWARDWQSKKPRAFLPLHSQASARAQAQTHGRGGPEERGGTLYPLLTNRNSILVAQMSAAMADSLVLAQSLLLLPEEGGDGPRLTHLIPFVFFSGTTMHSILNGRTPTSASEFEWSEKDQETLESCLGAVAEGREDAVVGWHTAPKEKVKEVNAEKGEKGEEEARVWKRGRSGRDGSPGPKEAGGWSRDTGASGRFDLLRSMPE
jgi:hypothetical protein